MSTATAESTKTSTSDSELRVKKDRWGTFRTYLGVAIIVIWGLIPFYWMFVTAIRPVGFSASASANNAGFSASIVGHTPPGK